MDAIRLPSITMSTGPRGGPPEPSIIVAPRMTKRSKGPSPSARSGPGRIDFGFSCEYVNVNNTVNKTVIRIIFFIRLNSLFLF